MRPEAFFTFLTEKLPTLGVISASVGVLALAACGPKAKPTFNPAKLPVCEGGLPRFERANSRYPEIGYRHSEQCATPTTDLDPNFPQNIDPEDPDYQIGPGHTFRVTCVLHKDSSLSVVLQNGTKRAAELSLDALDHLPPNIPRCPLS